MNKIGVGIAYGLLSSSPRSQVSEICTRLFFAKKLGRLVPRAEPRMENAERRPRLVIAEDAVLIQENIRKVVQRDCDVVAAVEDGEGVFEAVAAYAPDILLLDVSLPGMNGFAVAERLRDSKSPVHVIFLTAHRDKNYAKRAFEIGAKGYILKGSMWTELPVAIRAVASGDCYRSPLVF